MPDPLQALLAAGAVPSTTFPPTSRYAHTPVDALGPRRRRVTGAVPRAAGSARSRTASRSSTRSRSSRATGATCSAARHLGDAELWWRLADANGAIDPRELTDDRSARVAAGITAARRACRGPSNG